MTGKIQYGNANDLAWSMQPMHATTFAAWCARYGGKDNIDRAKACMRTEGLIDLHACHYNMGDVMQRFQEATSLAGGDAIYAARISHFSNQGSIGKAPIDLLRDMSITEYATAMSTDMELRLFTQCYIAATLIVQDRNIGSSIRFNLTRSGFMFLPRILGYDFVTG